MSDAIIIGPDHPAWKALDDDDWNGSAFGNWLTTVGESDVILCPPANWTTENIERMRSVMERNAKSVVVRMGL